MDPRRVVSIGTRKSRLALWQANTVTDLLKEMDPETEWNVKGILSTGDKNLEISLSSFSDKGVFTKELDNALLDGTIDVAVHSMKDLPTTLPDGICLAAVLNRADTRDCVVFSPSMREKGLTSLSSLPAGSVVGTSSVRRRALLGRSFPDLNTKDIRGNVDTRLQKLDSGEYDATILASAGLLRLELGERIGEMLETDIFPYAVCQGALAVVCRDSEKDFPLKQQLSKLSDRDTLVSCSAERAMLRTLEGGCKVPIATRSSIVDEVLHLYGAVMSLKGDDIAEYEVSTQLVQGDSSISAAENLGYKVATKLVELGARRILQTVRESTQH